MPADSHIGTFLNFRNTYGVSYINNSKYVVPQALVSKG